MHIVKHVTSGGHMPKQSAEPTQPVMPFDGTLLQTAVAVAAMPEGTEDARIAVNEPIPEHDWMGASLAWQREANFRNMAETFVRDWQQSGYTLAELATYVKEKQDGKA